jgi:hypothetical protein
MAWDGTAAAVMPGGRWGWGQSEVFFAAVPQPACGHHDRVKMPATCCPIVMVGHVLAIRSESLSRLVAGTCPAMTIGRTSVIAIFVADDADGHGWDR